MNDRPIPDSGARPAPIRVLVVGDPYFSVADFKPAMGGLVPTVTFDYLQIDTTSAPAPRTASERRLREYAGDPALVTMAVPNHDALVVHGAPVSAETLDCPELRFVCCVRGGPVNVDLEAATERGVPVCTSPGKNAVAVAELTIAFVLMSMRSIAASAREFAQLPELGSVFDGRVHLGFEAEATTLGLVGFGRVGHEVARRALALGFSVVAHDPFVSPGVDGVEMVTLDDLLGRSDVVSLHARGAADGRPLMGEAQFQAMRRGACFVNTAREQLVNESALGRALDEGRIRAAAMDVIEPGTGTSRNPLVDRPNVLVTPHIGGATRETLQRGAQMAADAIRAHRDGRPLPYLANANVETRRPVAP